MSGPENIWEAVAPDDPRGQPSAAYRGLVCYVSTDPCLAVVTADGRAVPSDQWPRIARLIAACPTMADYILRRADAGDAEAARIAEAFNAPR